MGRKIEEIRREEEEKVIERVEGREKEGKGSKGKEREGREEKGRGK